MPIRNVILNTETLTEGSNIINERFLYYFNVCEPFLLHLLHLFIICIVFIVYNHTGPN